MAGKQPGITEKGSRMRVALGADHGGYSLKMSYWHVCKDNTTYWTWVLVSTTRTTTTPITQKPSPKL